MFGYRSGGEWQVSWNGKCRAGEGQRLRGDPVVINLYHQALRYFRQAPGFFSRGIHGASGGVSHAIVATGVLAEPVQQGAQIARAAASSCSWLGTKNAPNQGNYARTPAVGKCIQGLSALDALAFRVY